MKKNINNNLAHRFLLLTVIGLGIAVLWMFKPFLINIVLAGVIATFAYPAFLFVLKYVRHRGLASLITTIIIALLVFGPFVNFLVYLINQTISAYQEYSPYLSSPEFLSQATHKMERLLALIRMTPEDAMELISQFSSQLNAQLVSFSGYLVRGTTSFFMSTVIIFLTIFYLFIDGKVLLRKIMNLTPFPNKYDLMMFDTFKKMSYSAIVSTLAVAAFQGLVGGIGFFLVGLPGFFGGIAIAIMSVLPYIGSFLIWGPVMIYMLITGSVAKAIILLVAGIILSTGDNVLRAFIIKGRAQVHELLVFFSIIGGITVFGFWGIVLGPLIFSLFRTVIHIYETEFGNDLEKALD